MAAGWVLCVVMTAVAAAAADDGSLAARLEAVEAAQERDRAELRRLRDRLADRDRLQDGLAQLRHELQSLSQHMGGEAAVRDDMVELRVEIDSISNELRVVKSRQPPASGAAVPDTAAADHTVVLWLRDTVTSLRRQLAELAKSTNTSSQLLQLTQEATVRFDQVQLEMRRLAEQQQKLHAQHETERSQLAQQRADLADLLASVRHQQNTYTGLLDEVATLRRELLLGGANWAPSVSGRRRRHRQGPRHHRRHRHRHATQFGQRILTDVMEVLYAKQQRLDDQQLAAERNGTALRTRLREHDRRLDQLELRLEHAEREGQQLSWRINASDTSGVASALKQSTSVLIREVEQLETKLDGKTAAVQSELARLDVSCSQLAASVSDLQERQAGLPEHVSRLEQLVAALKQQQPVTRAQLMALQSDLLTLSLDRQRPTEPTDRPAT